MKLITISASNRCFNCGGTGIKTSDIYNAGTKTVTLSVCTCVTTRVAKPKSFAEEVATHLKRKRRSPEEKK